MGTGWRGIAERRAQGAATEPPRPGRLASGTPTRNGGRVEALSLALAVVVASSCVGVTYQRAGQPIAPRSTHEVWSVARGELGDASVLMLPIEEVRATVERHFGTLPEAPVQSRWWAGELLPGVTDAHLASRARALLDGGCATAATVTALAAGSTPPDTSDPARIAIHGMDDSIIGYLVLGRSTPAEAARLLSAHGGLGSRRDNEVAFQVGSATLRPRLLYTPPGTMHQLYFENDTLVLVVDGMPHGVPGTRLEFMKSYPTARETRRESGWYELQTPLDECVWVIAVFTVTADRLDSVGYATVCSR